MNLKPDNRCEENKIEEVEEEESGCDYSGQESAEARDDKDHCRGSDYVIARNETNAVRCSRLAVLLVLVCSAFGAAMTTFLYVGGSEKSQFEKKFKDDSTKIIDSIGGSLDRTLALLDSLTVSLVSSARESGDKWPFVTMPDFGIRMSKIYPLSHTVSISVLPIVTPDERREWEAYSIEHDYWVNESMGVQETWDRYYGPVVYNWDPNGVIFGDDGDIPYNVTDRLFLPMWLSFPAIPTEYAPYNWDWMSSSNPESMTSCIESLTAVVSDADMIPTPNDPVEQAETEAWSDWFRAYLPPGEEPVEPVSNIFYPIIDDMSHVELDDSKSNSLRVVGMIAADFYWREMLRNILPTDSRGIDVVFENPCNAAFTYRIQGPNAQYRGVGDLHEKRYKHHGIVKKLTHAALSSSYANEYSGVPLNTEYCQFTLHVYPSAETEAHHTTNNRVIFTAFSIAIFAFTSMVFCLYDLTVERRQKIVMTTAIQSTSIVSSLFPEDVRDRMYHAGGHTQSNAKGRFPTAGIGRVGQASSESNALLGGIELFSSSPIADLYPETTVLFADIVGFTSWSSQRQPTQVFRLLETVYYSFDVIAKQRGVFKVETIGDSYVAVVGLPSSREHHAVVMARFARDIRRKMAEVVVELDVLLGPGTADLALRIGLNSGATTAGVLRGEKSRFQLFGDTVNTAARMESNGERNKIHVSQKTATLITASGKGHWLTTRSDKVNAKGKGMMQTFWCEPKQMGYGSQAESSQYSSVDDDTEGGKNKGAIIDDRISRLVDWHVDLFLGIVQKVDSRRTESSTGSEVVALIDEKSSATSRDEVANICIPSNLSTLPSSATLDNDAVPMRSSVKTQLRELIENVAMLYPANEFHSFAHCSHVVMSTKKLLDKINVQEDTGSSSTLNALVKRVLVEPLTQLAVLFAALIHDIEHPGVSNAQQAKEQTAMSVVYRGKSVAEQNSLDVAWRLLMEPKYDTLRAAIFSNKDDIQQFRQIVVNVLMATDLFDSDLKSARDSRWRNAMWGSEEPAEVSRHDEDALALASCRVTCIIELIISVSDISHTMQHFSTYIQWNLRLLNEMQSAYQQGHADTDPTKGWYEGELWFFDTTVIPLAEKLKACGMFGVLGDEFLGYAKDNRMEWETTGRDIVSKFEDLLD